MLYIYSLLIPIIVPTSYFIYTTFKKLNNKIDKIDNKLIDRCNYLHSSINININKLELLKLHIDTINSDIDKIKIYMDDLYKMHNHHNNKYEDNIKLLNCKINEMNEDIILNKNLYNITFNELKTDFETNYDELKQSILHESLSNQIAFENIINKIKDNDNDNDNDNDKFIIRFNNLNQINLF
jgi:hypothetical protein